MERLPTELVIQILDYMSTEELKIIGFISSEYRSLVIPFLFRRICPWWWRATKRDISDLIACFRNNHRLSPVVRVLDARAIKTCQHPLGELRQIMEIASWWEGLILPIDENIPLAVFDDNTKLRLRHLKFIPGLAGPKFSHLLRYILPSCTNLIDLEIPMLEVEKDWFKTYDPSGSATTMWINRLERYSGPSYHLNYLLNDAPLRRLISNTPALSPMLKRLGRLVGQQLLTLHVNMSLTRNPDSTLIGEYYLSPSLFPSSFPNVRYVSWFLIKSQPESTPDDLSLPQTKFISDEATLDVNKALLDAIQQLHCLRHVWFTSHHKGKTLTESVLTFVEKVQEMSLPYFHGISLWTPNSEPYSCSYTFRKEEAVSVNGGGYTKWVYETNAPIFLSIN